MFYCHVSFRGFRSFSTSSACSPIVHGVHFFLGSPGPQAVRKWGLPLSENHGPGKMKKKQLLSKAIPYLEVQDTVGNWLYVGL